MELDWDHVRIFLAVARSGQILAASNSLKLDHATVSRRLNAFEEQLQARVFERSPGGCTLTDAGELLLPMAERVEAEFLRVESLIAKSDKNVTGTVKIGAADGFGTYFLAPYLQPLVHQYMGISLHILPLPQIFSVSKREVDIAITLEPPTDGRLLCQRLIDYELNLYISNDYPLKDVLLRDIGDLREHMVVTPMLEKAYPTTVSFFQGIAQNSPNRYECASVAAQLESVIAGVGVGVLPNYLAHRFPSLITVLPDVNCQRTYWLVSHPDARNVARTMIVRRTIVDLVREHRRLFTSLTVNQ